MSFRLTFVLAFLLMVPASQAQDQLRWKFQSNDTVKYQVVQNMQSTTAFGDEELKSTFIQAIDMTWQVLAVGANGDVQLNQIFDRVRLKMEGGPAGTIEFDTASGEAAESPVVRELAMVFGNIVNQKFQVQMGQDGQIEQVVIPPKLLEAVKASTAGQQGALNEKVLNDMMKQSAVILPTQPVSPGSEWTSEQTVQMPFGEMTITSQMTYVQKDPTGNAIIDFVPTVRITPREGTAAKMTLESSTGRGRIVFDVDQGRVNRTQLDLTMQITVESNGRKLPQTIRNRTTMTLVP